MYLKLLWIGENSLKFDRKIKPSIHNCFGAVQPRVVLLPEDFYLQYLRAFFPLFNRVMSYMNTGATMIFDTWVKRSNVCRTKSASRCLSLLGTELVKNENNQNAKINQLILYRIVTRRLEIICYTIKNVHLTTRTINFLFFLNHKSDFY